MINIGGIQNLFNQKNTVAIKDQISTKKDKQIFSDVLDSEKKSLVFKKQEKKTQGMSNSQDITNNASKQTKNSVSSSNEMSGGETKITDKENKALNSKENEKLEIRNSEAVSQDDAEVLDHIISLLQSLINTIPVDISEVETNSNTDMELNTAKMESLADLTTQLSHLLDTMDIEANPSLEENLETMLSLINKITDQMLLNAKDGTFVQGENGSEILNNLEQLKSNIEFILTNGNFAKDINLQSLGNKNELELTNKQEKSVSEDDKIIIDDPATDKENNGKIKNLHKHLLTDIGENDEFSKEHEQFKNIIINDDILIHQQEKFDQKISVSVVKNEIIEPKQFISQIAQKAGAFLSKDRNEMSIQLTPENLGKISIKIGLNDGTLTGKIYAENYSVKEIIETNLNQLRDALEEKGLSISGLEVHVGDNSQNFGSKLFQSRLTNKQKSKEVSTVSNNTFLTLEQEINEKNPYLVSSQFDGLV